MHVQVSLTANTTKEVAFLTSILEMVSASADGNTVHVTTTNLGKPVDDEEVTPPVKNKGGRPKKPKEESDDTEEEKPKKKKLVPVMEVEDDEDDDSDDEDDSDEDEESDEDDTADDDDVPPSKPKKKEVGEAPAPKKKGATTQKDIIAMFKAYSDEHGRPKALKILKKFEVKSVLDLDEAIYPDVIKALKK